MPLSCCVGPSLVFRQQYGRFPIPWEARLLVKEGMSAEEVQAALGEPQEIVKRDSGDRWYYYTDSFHIGIFAIDFGQEGRVRRTVWW